jgi:hypothetical protein
MSRYLEVGIIIFCGTINIIAYYWNNSRIED